MDVLCILNCSSSSDIGELKPLSRPVEEQPETTWFCKNSNTSKILTNVKLRGGLKAGNITNKGAVTNYHQCVGYCCQDKHCNVAMTIRNNCFLVACKSYSDCLLQEATDLHSQVVYVNWETPTDEVLTKGWCKWCTYSLQYSQLVILARRGNY